MFHALYALTEELYDGGKNVQKEQRMEMIISPESTRIPIKALTEPEWFEFNNVWDQLELTVYQALYAQFQDPSTEDT